MTGFTLDFRTNILLPDAVGYANPYRGIRDGAADDMRPNAKKY